MEEIPEPRNNNPEEEDPLVAPISEDAALIERAAEINSGSGPRKSMRQRLGSMAARRSTRRYEAGSNVRPHIVEQAVIAEMGRVIARRTAEP